MKIKYVNTDATKGVLPVGTLGYDAYVAGGDEGRVGVGTASGNVLLAKKSEVDAILAGQLDSRYYTETEVDTNISTEITNRAQIGKNAIINGDFSVQQYPTDIDTAPVSATNAVYNIDRQRNYISVITATIQRLTAQTVNSKVANTLKFVATSTGVGRLGSLQRSENFFKGETKTFGVWVKSNNSNARLAIWDGVSISSSSPHTGGGGWEFLTLTKTISASSTILELRVIIDNAAGSTASITTGDYIESTMWQLEDGSVATPFEQRPIGLELSLCQRYYETGKYQSYRPTGGTGYDGETVYYKAEKRVIPTLTITDMASTVGKISILSAGNGVKIDNIGYFSNASHTKYFNILKTVASTSYGILYYWIANAEM